MNCCQNPTIKKKIITVQQIPKKAFSFDFFYAVLQRITSLTKQLLKHYHDGENKSSFTPNLTDLS